MPTFYAGSKDQTTPIVAPGTQDYSAVYPPEYQKQAWQWEEDRRAAERQREMMDMAGGPENFAQAQKATAAAEQFQAMRQADRLMAEGKTAEAQSLIGRVIALSSNAGQAKALASLYAPKPQASTEERTIGDRKFIVVSQPSGHVQYIDVTTKPVVEPNIAPIKRREYAAQLEVDKASQDLEAVSAMRDEITNPNPVRKALGSMGIMSPAAASVTNRVPVKPYELQQAKQARDAAQKRLEAVQGELAAFIPQAVSRAPGAPVVAPSRPSKPLTKEALKEARQAAGGDKAVAQQWLLDNGYSF